MIDFGALVQEDENMVSEPANFDTVDGITSSKEKIDIEMGTKLVEEGGILIPEILQNLSYDHIEDDIRSKEEKPNGSDPSIFYFEQESKDFSRRSTVREEKTDPELSLLLVELEPKGSPRSSTTNNGINKKESFDGLSDFNEIITPVTQV